MKPVIWLFIALIGTATLAFFGGAEPRELMWQAYDFVTVNKLMVIVGLVVLIAVRFVYTLPRTH